MSLILEDIPLIMDSMGWTVSARLMRHWFTLPPWPMDVPTKRGWIDPINLPRERLNDSIVTMAWAQRFARVGSGSNAVLALWQGPSQIDLLRRRVNRMAPQMGAPPWRFGDLRAGAARIDATCQIALVTVGDIDNDPLDDCYGALGVFNIKLAVSGIVLQEPSGRVIMVDQVGIYIRDAYDFVGRQFLGMWRADGIVPRGSTMGNLGNLASSYDMPIVRQRGSAPRPGQGGDGPGGTGPGPLDARGDNRIYRVWNASFADWRDRNGRGGDFIVLSDVAISNLAHPVRVPI